MYLEHFGLAEPPFRITPHTDFFFSGANRGATLEALVYAITHDEGIVKVSGEVGSGKTMLCRVLMERLPPHVDTVYLANPSLSRDDILYAIVAELGLTVADNARTSAVQRMLQDHLVTIYGAGRQIVVLIDEAHAMPAETLEEIRLLSNLESNRHKLLQLVLFGQPELNDILARPDMRQLKERITHNFTLEPLVRNDIAHYLDFRMRAAGYRGPEVFGAAAVKLIAGTSLGLTRRINILADKALLAAFAANDHQITPKEVKAAIRDSEFARTARSASRRHLIVGAAVAGTALLALTLVLRNKQVAEPAPAFPPATSQAPSNLPSATAAPAPTVVRPPLETAAAPPAKVAKAALTAAAGGTGPQGDWPELGPVTRQLAIESRAWLAMAPDERWFLQLVRTNVSQAPRVEAVAAIASELLRKEQVKVYAIELDGIRRLGVIYGDFASQAEAAAAAADLPQGLKVLTPYPRQVRRLR
ncbi:MAG: hypothetical protein A2045_07635 [Rhodocyclales bacterium GWA2_65_20]|nr:MAG: hypothetical protein A2045_07635 [Rhodocyclales bacterium GWA2_65_20]